MSASKPPPVPLFPTCGAFRLPRPIPYPWQPEPGEVRFLYWMAANGSTPIRSGGPFANKRYTLLCGRRTYRSPAPSPRNDNADCPHARRVRPDLHPGFARDLHRRRGVRRRSERADPAMPDPHPPPRPTRPGQKVRYLPPHPSGPQMFSTVRQGLYRSKRVIRATRAFVKKPLRMTEETRQSMNVPQTRRFVVRGG